MKKMILCLVLGLALGFVASTMLTAGDHKREVIRAIKHLDVARMDLERAGDDWGGHRAKALELVRGAKGELQAALDFYNNGGAMPMNH